MTARLASTSCRAVGIVLLPILLFGCGTTGQPVQQSVWVETPDCAAASCELRNDRGLWTLARTPGRATVTTSQTPLEVVCRAGELRTSATARSAVPSVGGGGAVAGGLVGAGAMGAATAGAAAFGGPFVLLTVMAVMAGAAAGAGAGYLVEAGTRAIAYPERIVVPLRCEVAGEGEPRIGVTVRGLTDEEAHRAQVPVGSALVLTVVEGSRAAAAGLRAGDLVLRVNDVPIDSAARLETLVRALPPDSAVTLQVQRDNAAIELRVPSAPAQ